MSSESPRPRIAPSQTPLVAVAAAAFLVALKGAGAWLTGSLALGSAALDSAVDLFVSGANFLVLRRSARPPDEDHAYGHGKFENLSALGQGLFLVAAAAGLVWTGVRRLIEGGKPEQTGWGIAVLAVSMAVSVWITAVSVLISGRVAPVLIFSAGGVALGEAPDRRRET